jgi:hypothetical protein
MTPACDAGDRRFEFCLVPPLNFLTTEGLVSGDSLPGPGISSPVYGNCAIAHAIAGLCATTLFRLVGFTVASALHTWPVAGGEILVPVSVTRTESAARSDVTQP